MTKYFIILSIFEAECKAAIRKTISTLRLIKIEFTLIAIHFINTLIMLKSKAHIRAHLIFRI